MTAALTACPDPVAPPSAPVGGEQPAGQPAAAPGPQQGGEPAQAPAPGGAPTEIKKIFPLPLDMLPPDIMTQEQVKAGEHVTFKGVLLGDECKGKRIRLDVIEQGSSVNRLITVLNLNDIGQYSVVVPKSDKKVYVVAACDIDGDNAVHQEDEFNGAYAKNPVAPNQDVSELVIRLMKGAAKEGAPSAPLPPGQDNAAPPAAAPGAAAPAPGAAAPAPGAPPAAAPAPGAAAPGAKPATAPAAGAKPATPGAAAPASGNK
ncbi:MAG: hypothetical protein ACKO6N_29825 [Myxococcota bacterium]